MKFIRNILIMMFFALSSTLMAQTNGDKLFMEGQELQQTRTVVAQNKAIKKFQAAKVVYTSADKKKMCDNQITICKGIIASIKNQNKKTGQTEEKREEPKGITLSKNIVEFDGDKSDMEIVNVTAPSDDWKFSYVEATENYQDFAKVSQNVEEKALKITVEPNTSTLIRKQGLKVYCGETSEYLLISQRGKSVKMSTSSLYLEFKPKGGKKTIELYTNSDSIIESNQGLTWYVASKPDWIEVITDTSKKNGGLSGMIKGIVSSSSTTQDSDTKKSYVQIIARTLPKSDPAYDTGRKGEVVFASQDKTCTIILLQQ